MFYLFKETALFFLNKRQVDLPAFAESDAFLKRMYYIVVVKKYLYLR